MENFLTTKSKSTQKIEDTDKANNDIDALTPNPKEVKLKKKERKMLFDRGYTDYFEEKQESKIYAVREKAYHLKEKISENFIAKEGAKRFVNDQIEKLKTEWPALFGAKVTTIYVHVDLDSFYASVETLLNPSLKDVPLGVGSTNMLAACNYKAREYGVKAGMPGYQAQELCPMLVITKLNYDQYNYYSELVMETLTIYDTEIEIYGIDEASLVFDDKKLRKAYASYNLEVKKRGMGRQEELIYKGFSFESVEEITEKIRTMVFLNSNLTISAGMSVCRGLSKFSSKVNKPNGQFAIKKDFDNFILNLDVDEINGIGKYTRELLNKTLEVFFIKDLRSKLYLCSIVFKQKTFDNLMRLSFGLSLFDIEKQKERLNRSCKSHAVEMSVKDVFTYSDVLFYIWSFSKVLERSIEKSGKPGMIVTLSIKYINFDLISRRKKSAVVISTSVQIFNSCLELIKECFNKDKVTNEYSPIHPIRMLGVKVSDLYKAELVKTVDTHFDEKMVYNERKCIICGVVFINEPDFAFQVHVNRCVDQSTKKDNEQLKSLSQIFVFNSKKLKKVKSIESINFKHNKVSTTSQEQR